MVIALGLLPWLAPSARATTGDYLNLSFTGDGETPSALERFASAQPKGASALAGGVGGSQSGDASWATEVALPPALLAPSVSIRYGSGGSYGRLGRGFSLSAGPTIRKLSPRERAGLQALPNAPTTAEVYRLEGPVSGLFWLGTSSYRWMSDTHPVAVQVTAAGGGFTVVADGTTWTMAADNTGTVTGWHATSAVDANGNRIDWTYTGDRVDRIDYGGTSAGSPCG